MKKKINIGIIGTGVGLRTHLPAFEDITNCKVVALAGSSLRRAEEFATQNTIEIALNYQELCKHPEIDLICVTSPNRFHAEQVLTALKAGKHVLCEKPLTLTIPDARQLVNESKVRPNQLALVNHQLRFNPYVMAVKKMLDDGMIGRPYFIRIHQQSTGFSNPKATWNWSFDANQGGGVLLAMGSHLVDLLNYWINQEVDCVDGVLDPVVMERKNALGENVEVKASSFVGASIRFSNGVNAQLSATAAAHSASTFEFRIYGEFGEIHFDLENKLMGTFASKPGPLEKILVQGVRSAELANKVSIFSGSFPYFADKIVCALLDESWSTIEIAANFSDALNTQIILEAITDSANEGKTIRLTNDFQNKQYM